MFGFLFLITKSINTLVLVEKNVTNNLVLLLFTYWSINISNIIHYISLTGGTLQMSNAHVMLCILSKYRLIKFHKDTYSIKKPNFSSN